MEEQIKNHWVNGQWDGYNSSPYVSVVAREKSKKIRSKLRDRGILPPYGQPLNEEQQSLIYDMSQGDFSFWENLKIKEMNERYGYTKKSYSVNEDVSVIRVPKYEGTNSVKQHLYRLRLLEIIPEIGIEVTDDQQMIIDDVYENAETVTKNFFKKKYYHLSTKRGRLYYRVKFNRNNHKVGIVQKDIIPVDKCPYLGIDLSYEKEDKDKDNYATIDRIDSSKGYIVGNIEVVSLKSNRMKNKATELELLQFSTNALNLLNEEKI